MPRGAEPSVAYDPLFLAWGASTVAGDPLMRNYAGFRPGDGPVVFPSAPMEIRRLHYGSPLEVAVQIASSGVVALTALSLFVESVRRVYRTTRGFELDKGTLDARLAELGGGYG